MSEEIFEVMRVLGKSKEDDMWHWRAKLRYIGLSIRRFFRYRNKAVTVKNRLSEV